MTTGLAIYKLRLEAGKTTAEAAAEVLVDQRSWQRWESGTHRPILGLIKLFCVLNAINFDKYQELIDEPSPEVLLPQAPDFTEKELLRIIHETGKEKKTDYLPIFFVREKIPR